jgi:hypothetical protein
MDLGQFGCAGAWVRGAVGGHCRRLPLLGVLPLPLAGEDLPARPDPLHEQPVDHSGVHAPGQA